MVNQTLIPIDNKYPERQVLADNLTSWDLVVPGYEPPLCPDFELIAERLSEQGVEVADASVLRQLARLSTAHAMEVVGPAIAKIRHPLGRTGINGTGIFYKAGRSRTADIAILRHDPWGGIQLGLIYNRGKWRLPGGFIDEADGGDLVRTAIREGIEETSLDLNSCLGNVTTLIPEQVKPNSRRSVDLGYITSQVSTVMLPDIEMSFGLMAGDDAEAAAWFDELDVKENHQNDLISSDHFSYMQLAFGYAKKQTES